MSTTCPEPSVARLVLTRLCATGWAGGRSGRLETRPRCMTFVISGEMGCGGESVGSFGQLPDPVEDRQQVDVCECQLVTREMAGLGDRLVENPDLLAHGRHHRFDRFSVGLAIGGLRRGI